MKHKAQRSLMGSAVLVILLVVMLVVGLFNATRESAQPSVLPTIATPNPTATSPSPVDASPHVAKLPKGCRNQSQERFVPQRAILRGITKTSVLALGLDENDAPAAPPFSEPDVFSWYKLGRAPGSEQGNVLLLAHTFSDRPVLGNVLLQQLHQGDLIILRGGSKEQRICYRVSAPAESVAVNDYAKKAYQWYNSPQLVITVCSSYNRETGEWEQRTLWFASPVK